MLHRLGDVEVVPDPEPNRVDPWRAHRAALEAMPADATHLLVVQDDAIPTTGAVERVEQAVLDHPESLLLAFVPGFATEIRWLRKAKAAGAAYTPFPTRSYVPLVAAIYPRTVVDGLLAWHASRDRPFHGADDGIVAAYCRRVRLTPLMMVPCAFDHDDALPSIGKAPRRGAHRRAALL